MANSVIVSMVGNRGKSVEKKWTDTESFYNELSFYFRLKSVLNHDDWFVIGGEMEMGIVDQVERYRIFFLDLIGKPTTGNAMSLPTMLLISNRINGK